MYKTRSFYAWAVADSKAQAATVTNFGVYSFYKNDHIYILRSYVKQYDFIRKIKNVNANDICNRFSPVNFIATKQKLLGSINIRSVLLRKNADYSYGRKPCTLIYYSSKHTQK